MYVNILSKPLFSRCLEGKYQQMYAWFCQIWTHVMSVFLKYTVVISPTHVSDSTDTVYTQLLNKSRANLILAKPLSQSDKTLLI